MDPTTWLASVWAATPPALQQAWAAFAAALPAALTGQADTDAWMVLAARQQMEDLIDAVAEQVNASALGMAAAQLLHAYARRVLDGLEEPGAEPDTMPASLRRLGAALASGNPAAVLDSLADTALDAVQGEEGAAPPGGTVPEA